LKAKLHKSFLPPHPDRWKSLLLQASVHAEIGKRHEGESGAKKRFP